MRTHARTILFCWSALLALPLGAGCTRTVGDEADRLFRDGYYAEASEAYHQAALADPNEDRWRRGYRLSRRRAAEDEVALAEEDARAGDLPGSLEHYDRAIRWYPPDPAFAEARDGVAADLARARALHRVLAEAIEADDLVRAQETLGALEPYAASFDDMDELRRRVALGAGTAQLTDDEVRSLVAEGDAAMGRGDPVGAARAYGRALAARPGRDDLAERAGRARRDAARALASSAGAALEDGRIGEALRDAARAVFFSPDDREIRELHRNAIARATGALVARAREAETRGLVGLAALRYRQAVELGAGADVRASAQRAEERLAARVRPSIISGPVVVAEPLRDDLPGTRALSLSVLEQRGLRATRDVPMGDSISPDALILTIAETALSTLDARWSGSSPTAEPPRPPSTESDIDRLRFAADRADVARRDAEAALQQARDDEAYWQARLDEAADDAHRFLAEDRLRRVRGLLGHRERVAEARRAAYASAEEAYDEALAHMEAPPAQQSEVVAPEERPSALPRARARIGLRSADGRALIRDGETVEVVLDASARAGRALEEAATDALAEAIADRVVEALDGEFAALGEDAAGIGAGAPAEMIDGAVIYLRWQEVRGVERDALLVSGLREATGYDLETDRTDLSRLDLGR